MGLRGRNGKSGRQMRMGLGASAGLGRSRPRPVPRSCQGTHKKGLLYLNGVMEGGGQGVPQADCILVRAWREVSGPKDFSSSGG